MNQMRYNKLLAIRQSYIDDLQPDESSVAWPFVPVFGAGGALPYRFLIIGQATRDWADRAEHGTFERSGAQAADVLKDFLVNNNGPFWTFVRKFILGTLDVLGQACALEDLYKQVAWSNLAKIGVKAGNPSSELLRYQADICSEQLRCELDEYKPDVVLITSGNYGENELLYPAFGNEWPHLKQTEHVQVRFVKNSAGIGTPAIWTNHPRNLVSKNESHEVVLKPITNLAAGFLKL
jgi:hypothetical protein